MKFGPEVDDALGGRLEGVVFQLPNHCAAILRALLLNRESARLHVGMRTGETAENEYTLQFHASPINELSEKLYVYQQRGFAEEKDLTRKVSSKSIRVHLLRCGMNAGVALIQKTNASAHNVRVFQTIAFLPRLLPRLFSEKPLSETEKALLSAAFFVDYNTIEEILEKLYKESDLSNAREKRMIHNAISHRMNMALRTARDQAINAEQRADSLLQQYTSSVQVAMEQTILAKAYERRIEAQSEDVEEIMAFIDSIKTVRVTVDGNTMLLDVSGPLANFEPDAYRVIRDKPSAHFRSNIVGDHEDALLFFDALFLEESIKVLIGARYAIETHVGVRGIKRHAIQGTIPNPHIYYHACLGQFRCDMQEALAKSDFVGVISLCNASGVSLNIPESPTCGSFVRDVTSGSQKAIQLPTGEIVTYRKAVSWLKQQKGIEGGAELDGETNQDHGSGD